MTAMAPPIFSYANHDDNDFGDDSSAMCCPRRKKKPPKSKNTPLISDSDVGLRRFSRCCFFFAANAH
ncbi:hypothetical protein MRB53_007995 [Persea americana]|uniref:Uncharacterized protein n=1 Tax=Persea americana TaxID=3435 RepID=A0ACC2MM65_PERAE|nr:hypothetical protein MRB53_007995 [Persea americana]